MGQPILLLIYCDELRADALSCLGGPDGLTPNIDRLAREGQNFSRAYCSSPVCVPCRWSGLTGKSVNQTGVWHNEASWKNFSMSKVDPTVLEVFRSSNWRSVNVGKIHLPENRNPFDENYPDGGVQGGLTKQMKDWGRPLHGAPQGAQNLGGVWPENEPFPAEGIADKVLERISALDDRPLFIRASYLQPHTPVVPRESDFEKWFQEPGPDIGLKDTAPSRFEELFSQNFGSSEMDPEIARRCWWAYHALVHWVDRQVGRLLDGIEQLGRTEDLKVVFTADHGANLGEAGSWAKQSFRAASHRIPLIVWGTESGASHREDLSDSTDLARTLCDLADLDPLEEFGGRSVLTDEEPEEVISGIGYGLEWSHLMPNRSFGSWDEGRGWPRRVCVRTREWRYDRNVRFEGKDIGPDDPVADACLIHVKEDAREERNLARDERYVEVVRHLEKKMQLWLKDGTEPSTMPSPK